MSHDVEQAARQLRDAAASSQPGAPVRDLIGDVAQAYAVQALNNDAAVASGRGRNGYKIGLTSAPIQEYFGVDEPAFGVLFDDMCVADGAEIASDRLVQPRLEGEVAVVLSVDLDEGGYARGDIAAATAHVLPAIEIVDSRVANWDLTIVDMIADNAGGGLYVLGFDPVSVDDIDLARVPMSMSVGGEERSSGVGAACLGHPFNAVAWLANELVARGTPLRAGAHIMTGALGPIVALPPGQTVRADFGPLGSVTTVWAGGTGVAIRASCHKNMPG